MDHSATARLFALGTYGSDTHVCRCCGAELTASVVATRVHTLAVEHVTEGDLLCPADAADLAADGAKMLRESADLAARADVALFALDRVRDRWRIRQGHDGSFEHRNAVQAAWAEAMATAKMVSP